MLPITFTSVKELDAFFLLLKRGMELETSSEEPHECLRQSFRFNRQKLLTAMKLDDPSG